LGAGGWGQRDRSTRPCLACGAVEVQVLQGALGAALHPAAELLTGAWWQGGRTDQLGKYLASAGGEACGISSAMGTTVVNVDLTLTTPLAAVIKQSRSPGSGWCWLPPGCCHAAAPSPGRGALSGDPVDNTLQWYRHEMMHSGRAALVIGEILQMGTVGGCAVAMAASLQHECVGRGRPNNDMRPMSGGDRCAVHGISSTGSLAALMQWKGISCLALLPVRPDIQW
jgi:hypothetical protein